jgi:hypothetical protein
MKKLFDTWNSAKMIGNVKERFKQLERKGWDWSSFYNGWLEGRARMYAELSVQETEDGVREMEAIEILKQLEWAGHHTDDENWGVITIACPYCMNAKKDGHKENCKLAKLIWWKEK